MLSNALVLLGAAILVATIFHSVRLPPILGLITAGILVGPSGFALIESIPQVDSLTEIATVLLLFTIGLDFSFKEFKQFRRPLLILGVSQVVGTIIVFTGIFWIGFSMPLEKAIFISLLVAPSSTAVVFKLLYDNRDFETPYGKACFSILLLQDIAIIPMIFAVPFLAPQTPGASGDFLTTALPLLVVGALVVVLLFVLSKHVLPILFNRVSQTRNRELFFFTVLFICMGSAALMHNLGLSLSLGAFIAGMLLAGSSYGKQATAEILPLRDAFLSLFFITIGMMLDLKFLFYNFPKILFIGTLVVVLKCFILYTITWFTGSTSNVSRAVTALLFQFGEFSFILAELGTKHGLLPEKERQIFVAIAITSLGLTPLFYSRLGWIMNTMDIDRLLPSFARKRFVDWRQRVLTVIRPLDLEKMQSPKEFSDHVVVIGYGIAGQSLCRVLKHLEIPFNVVELNPETVRIYSPQVPIMYGDASNPQLLKRVGVERARLVAVVTSGVNMLQPILEAISQVNPNVRILARTNYLLDLKRLKNTERTSFVISELEATLKVIDDTLREFGVPEIQARDVMSALRKEF